MHIVHEQDKTKLNDLMDVVEKRGFNFATKSNKMRKIIQSFGWRIAVFKGNREHMAFWIGFNVGRFYEQDKFREDKPAPKPKTEAKAPKKSKVQEVAEKLVGAVALDNVGEASD
jgi:hypothetical protein